MFARTYIWRKVQYARYWRDFLKSQQVTSVQYLSLPSSIVRIVLLQTIIVRLQNKLARGAVISHY